MELQEFIKNFADQFDDINVNEINENTEYKELGGWNSLVALSVIAMVDEEFDVTLKGCDIRDPKTIGELYQLIQSKL